MNRNDYGNRLRALNARIAAALPAGEAQHGFYSAYTLKDGLPVDNLDKVAVKGPCRLAMSYDGFWGDGEDYLSEVLQSPTWLKVAVAANRGIITTGDYHHIYVEAVQKQRGITGVPVYTIWMGS